MALILKVPVYLSCILLVVSGASISGGAKSNDKGGVDVNIAANDKIGGVNIGAGAQGNTQRKVQAEIGAGQNGHSVKVNYDKAPGSSSYGPSATINLHSSDKSRIDATVSHSKNENKGFKFEENTGSLNYADANGNKAGVSLSHIPGIKDTFSQGASINVINSADHNLKIDAHRTEVKYNNGPRIEQYGGKATYENANGHGAFVGVNHSPQTQNTNIFAGGKANVFTSNDKSTNVGLTAGVQQSRSPVGVQTEGNVGLQVQVKMPAPRPTPKAKFFDRYDPRNSPHYYEGCGLCCWGSKLWSNQCATPDDYD